MGRLLLVAAERVQGPTGSGVPEPADHVIRDARQHPAVGRRHDATDPAPWASTVRTDPPELTSHQISLPSYPPETSEGPATARPVT